ncbi:MAG: bacterial transcriptional activator domain-containing protein [Armatimonadetes bacterium]|nr:bacterial transcriptional activator domain-containing protein [Armatimonadota bacterium]
MLPPQPMKLRTLGAIELRDGSGHRVDLPTRFGFVIVAMLLERSWSRLDLAKAVWEGKPETSQRASLRAALSSVRKALGVALVERDGRIWVERCHVEGDFLHPLHESEYPGDFFPGVEIDWVIGRRLELRQRAYDQAMVRANQFLVSQNRRAAIQELDRAISIDQLADEAVQLKLKILAELGRTGEIDTLRRSHSARVLRELGTVPEFAQEPVRQQETQPLLEAAIWIERTEPMRLIDFLASTSLQWQHMPVGPSLRLHTAALSVQHNTASTSSKIAVRATQIILRVQQDGIARDMTETLTALQEAEVAGEHVMAARIAGAVAYGYLSKGEFAKALAMATQAQVLSKRSTDPEIRILFRQLKAIIASHSGDIEESFRELAALPTESEDSCGLLTQGGIHLTAIESFLSTGQVEKAYHSLDRGRKVFESVGANRSIAWVRIGEAVIYRHVGDYFRALERLDLVKELGAELVGHSAISVADDLIASTYCTLNELSLAKDAFRRSISYRKQIGTVPSKLELPLIRQTATRLRETKFGK